jgi:hypothetical protein
MDMHVGDGDVTHGKFLCFAAWRACFQAIFAVFAGEVERQDPGTRCAIEFNLFGGNRRRLDRRFWRRLVTKFSILPTALDESSLRVPESFD